MAVNFKTKKYAGRLESANTSDTGFAIVQAVEVGGHRAVKSLAELYALSTPILSLSGDNTNNDAIGQEWYVTELDKKYKLVDWSKRQEAAGWSPVSDGMSAEDKETLDKLNQKVGDDLQSVVTGIDASAYADQVELDLSIRQDNDDQSGYENKTNSIIIPAATDVEAGVMTAEDKLRLDSTIVEADIMSASAVEEFLAQYDA